MQLGEVSGEISLKPNQVLLVIYHNSGNIKVLLCMHVSFQRAENSKPLYLLHVLIFFKLKALAKVDIIHDFTEISSKFPVHYRNLLKQVSNW